MKTASYVMIVFAIVIIIGQIIIIDFSSPGWKNNAGSYLGILSMIMLLALVVSYLVKEKRKKGEG